MRHDGRGRPFRTEVAVFRWEGSPLATNAVYWSGGSIGSSANPGGRAGLGGEPRLLGTSSAARA